MATSASGNGDPQGGARAAPLRDRELDIRGEDCPYTFLKSKLMLETMAAGQILRVIVGNETSALDVPRSLAAAGHDVLAVEPMGDRTWAIVVRKGG